MDALTDSVGITNLKEERKRVYVRGSREEKDSGNVLVKLSSQKEKKKNGKIAYINKEGNYNIIF